MFLPQDQQVYLWYFLNLGTDWYSKLFTKHTVNKSLTLLCSVTEITEGVANQTEATCIMCRSTWEQTGTVFLHSDVFVPSVTMLKDKQS